MKLNIEIDNLTEAQAEAFESMLQQYVSLSSIGSSRWVTFFVDGDGNFHPKITVNGHSPVLSKHLDLKEIWVDNECRIDFDTIATRTGRDLQSGFIVFSDNANLDNFTSEVPELISKKIQCYKSRNTFIYRGFDSEEVESLILLVAKHGGVVQSGRQYSPMDEDDTNTITP